MYQQLWGVKILKGKYVLGKRTENVEYHWRSWYSDNNMTGKLFEINQRQPLEIVAEYLNFF
jgi:hypothetical protein